MIDDDDEQSRWFFNEVQPHAPELRAYLKNAYPSVRDVDDVVQESFLQIWLARLAKPVHSAKALLFIMARHKAIDQIRRNKVSPIDKIRDLDGLNAIENGISVVDALNRQEKILMLAQAIDALPVRCREIVILRKLQVLSQKEVAAILRLSVNTVEAQLARGIKRCEAYLRKRGVQNYYADGSH